VSDSHSALIFLVKNARRRNLVHDAGDKCATGGALVKNARRRVSDQRRKQRKNE
jgi:hypothetical protein